MKTIISILFLTNLYFNVFSQDTLHYIGGSYDIGSLVKVDTRNISYSDTSCNKELKYLRVGEWRSYSKEGNLTSIGKYYPKAKCKQIEEVDSLGFVEVSLIIVYSKKGKWKYFNENGELVRIERYRRGKLIGKEEY